MPGAQKSRLPYGSIHGYCLSRLQRSSFNRTRLVLANPMTIGAKLYLILFVFPYNSIALTNRIALSANPKL
jgi:hypothetical protein